MKTNYLKTRDASADSNDHTGNLIAAAVQDTDLVISPDKREYRTVCHGKHYASSGLSG